MGFNLKTLAWVYVGFLSIVFAAFSTRNLLMDFHYDQSMMLYLAHAIKHGGVIYADTLSSDAPFTAFIAWCLSFFVNASFVQFGILHLIVLIIIGALLYVFLKDYSKAGALMAGLCYAYLTFYYHTYMTFQRDVILMVPLLICLICIYKNMQQAKWFYSVIAGAVIGVSMCMRPELLTYICSFGLITFIAINHEASLELKDRLRCSFFHMLYAIAGLLGFLLIFGLLFFLTIGSWQGFLEMATTVWPAYKSAVTYQGDLHDMSTIDFLFARFKFFMNTGVYEKLYLILIIPALLSTLLAWRKRCYSKLDRLLVAGLWVFALNNACLIFLSSIVYHYVWYPGCLLFLMIMAVNIGRLCAQENKFPRYSAIGIVFVLTVILGTRFHPIQTFVDLAEPDPQRLLVDEMTALIREDIKKRAIENPTHIAFGYDHKMMLIGAQSQTPIGYKYIFDIFLYFDPRNKKMKALREDFLQSLDASNATYLMRAKSHQAFCRYRQADKPIVEAFDEQIEQLVSEKYELIHDREGIKLYRIRDISSK